MIFTAEQQAAIDITRLGQNASVVAGPGSGKTAVLVERYRRLVESGIEPANILAITYTEKAAANMRLRMAKEFAGDAEMLRKLERGWVSTIHSFCQRLLKQHSTAAGVDPAFQILDEQQAVLEQAAALRLTLDELLKEQPTAMAALLEASTSPDFEELIPPIYDAMRAAGLTPDQLAAMSDGAPANIEEQIVSLASRYSLGFSTLKTTDAQRRARDMTREFLEQFSSAPDATGRMRLLLAFCPNKNTRNAESEVLKEIDALSARMLDRTFARERALLIEVFRRFDARYRNRKTLLGTLDFNDLEFFTVRLLESDAAIRAQIQEQFAQVMIDEFQDTSGLQSRLVKLVSAPGLLYAVGDLNQSIYSFRHARPDVFKLHRATVQQAGEHACELIENWRSRQAILDATQFVLKDVEGIERRDLKGARTFPDRDHAHVEALEFLRGADEDDYALEAQGIVTRILELLQSLRMTDGEETRPARLNDFAILVRNTAVLKDFVEAFTTAGVAYNLNRRTGFLETREARDCMHLLRVIHNPHDEVSTVALLRSPFAGISDEAVVALRPKDRNLGESIAAREFALLGDEDRVRIERFSNALREWRAAASFQTPDRLVLRALDQMGVAWNPSTPSGQNIEKFLSIARAQSEMTLPAFLNYLDAMRKKNPREQDSPVDEELDAVQIMTTHAAKGLEFPVVILAAMNKGIASDGSSGALNFTPEFGLGVKWCFENIRTKPGYVYEQNNAKLEATEEEEANRLLYVAMTRAEEHLILSWSRKRDSLKPSNWAKLVSVRFEMETISPDGQPVNRIFEDFDVRLLRSAEPLVATAAMAVADAAQPPAILQLPVLTDQFDPNTTATALSQFAFCPRKYYLGHYLGWKGDLVRPRADRSAAVRTGSTNMAAADIGTAVHHLLAGRSVPDAPFEAVSLAQTFERSALGKRVRKARRSEREWEFTFAIGELVVRGSIDLWFEDAQGLTIVDYKTDDVLSLETHSRSRDYQVQIQLYALALERAMGKRVTAAWLCFLRPNTEVSVPVEQAAANIEALAAAFVAAEEHLDFPLIPTPACRRCDFYHTLCPAKLAMDAHA